MGSAPPWRSRRKPILNGLHGICLVHSSSTEHLRTLCNDANSLDDSHSQRWIESPKLPLKSADFQSSQNFHLWDLFPVRKLWDQRPTWLRMSAPHCRGDRHIIERVANILTSIPFILIGIQAPRKKVATKMYADSVVGVGIASGFYHSSKGGARQLFRWGDYAMIATSTLFLSRALRRDDSKMLYVASAIFLPFQPMLVTAFHVGLMEITFAQRVQTEPHLRKAHVLHAASSIVGCALFIADDIYPDMPFLHAAWHLAAAVGVATCTKLLE